MKLKLGHWRGWRDKSSNFFFCEGAFDRVLMDNFHIGLQDYHTIYLSVFNTPGRDRQQFEIQGKDVIINKVRHYIATQTRDSLGQIWSDTKKLWFEVEYE